MNVAGMKCEQIRKRTVSAGDFSAYVAARFDYSLPGEMVLGDRTTSGPGDVFVNHPLRSGQLYRVFVTAYTSPSVSSLDDYIISEYQIVTAIIFVDF